MTENKRSLLKLKKHSQVTKTDQTTNFNLKITTIKSPAKKNQITKKDNIDIITTLKNQKTIKETKSREIPNLQIAKSNKIREFSLKISGDFPNIFNKDALVPLAKGIHKQLLAHYKDKYSTNIVRTVLGIWTHKPNYQNCLKVGASRLNLNGSYRVK